MRDWKTNFKMYTGGISHSGEPRGKRMGGSSTNRIPNLPIDSLLGSLSCAASSIRPSMRPSMYFLSPLILHSWSWVVIPDVIRAKGWLDPGQIASSLQGCRRETNKRSHTYRRRLRSDPQSVSAKLPAHYTLRTECWPPSPGLQFH